MKLFSIFRARRIFRDVGRIATSLERIDAALRQHYAIREPRAGIPSPIEFGEFSIADANKRWHEERAAAMIDEDE
jgi:hypothetical protein